MTTAKTDPNYRATRDAMIAANEGFSTNIYFDTNGIPTTGSGVALLDAKGNINTANMRLLADALGATSPEYQRIQDYVQAISSAIQGTPSTEGVRNASDLMASERGQAIVDKVGDLKYVPGSGFMPKDDKKAISITEAQAREVTTAAINVRESQLDKKIKDAGGDPDTLTTVERSMFMDVLYQYGANSSKLKEAIKAWVKGCSDLDLAGLLSSAKYPTRGKNFRLLLEGKFKVAKTIVSPIVLDLNGDGIATTGLSEGTHFDHDANGFAEGTGWINGADGILVRDLNGNGTIDTGRELFGSETLLANGQKAPNGYASLAELDDNHDGRIGAQDAAYTTLKIWKDANGDGYSSADELLTLAEAGVQSIATGFTAVDQTDANGNVTKQTSTFTRTDGTTGTSADIWFVEDKADTIATEWLPETAEVAALPDIQGSGNLYDLRQAMLRDSSGHLQSLVTQFVQATRKATGRRK